MSFMITGVSAASAKASSKGSVKLELMVRDARLKTKPYMKKTIQDTGREYMILKITPSKSEELRITFWNDYATKKKIYWTPTWLNEKVFKNEAEFNKEVAKIQKNYSKKDLPFNVYTIPKNKVKAGKTIYLQYDGAYLGSTDCEFVYTHSNWRPPYTPSKWQKEYTKITSLMGGYVPATNWRVQVDMGSASSGKKVMKEKPSTGYKNPKVITDKAFYVEMLKGINDIRAENNCKPVKLLWELQPETRTHSINMAKERKIWHYDLDDTYEKKYKEDDRKLHGGSGSEGVAFALLTSDAYHIGQRAAAHIGLASNTRDEYVWMSTVERMYNLYTTVRTARKGGIRCPKGCKIKHTKDFPVWIP